MFLLLLPLLQTEPTPDPKMDIIRFLIFLVTLLVSGSLVVTGGLLIFVISLIRSIRKDPTATVTLKNLIDALERSHPGAKQIVDELGDALTEGGKLLDDVTGNTPPTPDTKQTVTKQTVTVTATSEPVPPEPGLVG